jgi:methionine biosynthesis protein MetW
VRPDLAIIAGLVPRASRVLDLGCGDGELLAHLIANRGCSGMGVEASSEDFLRCVARGVPVVQGDIDQGLAEFADGAFDVVVLSQTLQATHRPLVVVSEMMRIGGVGIVSFPNFGFLRHRLMLGLGGRMPVSTVIPYPWHDTPNIHFCTIRDFESLLFEIGLEARSRLLLDERGRRAPTWARLRPNVLAAGAVYVVARRGYPSAS